MTDTERANIIQRLKDEGFTVIRGEFVPVKMYNSDELWYAPKSECKLIEKKAS